MGTFRYLPGRALTPTGLVFLAVHDIFFDRVIYGYSRLNCVAFAVSSVALLSAVAQTWFPSEETAWEPPPMAIRRAIVR